MKNPEQYRKIILKDAKKQQPLLPNPYYRELQELQFTPHQLTTIIPEVKFKDLRSIPLIFVQKVEELEELKNCLMHTTEFAVDLEHHSIRSYLGITCLMQISTRDCDYIIDVLLLRDHINILGEV